MSEVQEVLAQAYLDFEARRWVARYETTGGALPEGPPVGWAYVAKGADPWDEVTLK